MRLWKPKLQIWCVEPEFPSTPYPTWQTKIPNFQEINHYSAHKQHPTTNRQRAQESPGHDGGKRRYGSDKQLIAVTHTADDSEDTT